MARIRVSTTIEASVETVWEYVRRIDRHIEWMADAESISFQSAQTEGVGTAFVCLTKVGPLRLNDAMVVSEWTEKEAIGVRHTGLVAGEGRFTLAPAGTDRTEFCWTEALRFPWWMGGLMGDLVGARVLEWVWRRSLRTLRAQFSAD